MADGRYYWLRLKPDFFKRHDIRIIEGMPNGKDYILFYLKLLCESVDHEGNLRFSEQIPYSEQMLATITDTNVDIVRSAIQVFTSLGMMEIMDDGTYFMSEVDKLIGSSVDNPNANRQRRFREAQKLNALRNVTPPVTKNNESKSKSIEIETEIKKENTKRKKVDFEEVLGRFDIGDGLKETLRKFIEHRQAIGKEIKTEYALELIIKKVMKMTSKEEERCAIVEQSIENGWQGIFPIDRNRKQGNYGPNGVKLADDYDHVLDGVF